MSFLGIFSSLRRPIKPCCAAGHEAENIARQKLQFYLQKRLDVFPSLGSSLSSSVSSFRPTSSAQLIWNGMVKNLNDKLVLFGEILTKQCNFYAAQRLRRMAQVISLYKQLYTEHSMQNMVSRLVKRFHSDRSRSLGLLLGATVFSWEAEKITERDMKSCIDEFDELSASKQYHSLASRSGSKPQSSGGEKKSGGENCHSSGDSFWSVSQLQSQGWEPVIRSNHLHVWRKAVPSSYLYEYKVFGTFYDIPAQSFFSVQMDTDYRKKWDKLVIALDIIDKEEQEGCEVIHWIMHYPYPMYSRDYVYIRRSLVDQTQGVMVLMSRAIDHPKCPIDKKYVRVKKYFSQMVIRPHKSFEETGFDYLLTYFDDPEAAFPAPAYNWMASSGVPDFVEKLHTAARGLYFQSTPVIAPSSTPTGRHHSGPSLQQVYA